MRVVVADNHPIFRRMLIAHLKAAGIDVVGEAANEPELVTAVRAKSPDVVLTDLRMPEADKNAGLRAAKRIRQEHPAVGVMLLSAYGEAEYAAELLRELPDRVGYVLKDHVDDVAELILMLQRVASGGIAVDPHFVGRLLGRARHDNPLDRLSPQECKVLTLVAEGLSNNAIAQQLHTSDGAVEKAITAIRRKLKLTGIDNANARVNVVLAYLRYTGQLPPADNHGSIADLSQTNTITTRHRHTSGISPPNSEHHS